MRGRGIRQVVVAGALALAPYGAAAAPPSAWLHVRVEEAGRQSKVAVNLPVAAVEAALQFAPETIVKDGHIHLGHRHHKVSVADLRRMWSELKDAGDTEFATVEDEKETVRVARAGGLMLVHVDKADASESVRVEVPIEVVDALFATPGDRLDLKGAFAQLQKRRGDIVRVKDNDSTVRVWIDETR